LGHSVPKGVFNINDPACQQRLKDFFWRITEEWGEAANCLKNKPWKNTHMETDETHFLEEVIDAFHFTVEVLLHLGFTPESLVVMYLNKNDVNKFRIKSNY
jgi:dimeric dUTPase (all-alpha-NTP-PPase superfamily)